MHLGSLVTGIVAGAICAGCVPMAKFSTTATEYNLQTATAQDRTLLLNIVRAAHRYPMHFTELTTLTGSGTLTLGGTITAPIGILNGGMGTGSIAPTGSITETPTFNVAVLETQEFYQGMMKPMTAQQVATYLEEGFQPEIIFTLFLESIEYAPLPNWKSSVLENNFHPIKCSNLHHEGCPTDVPPSPPGTTPPGFQNGDPCPTGRAGNGISEYECFRAVLRALLERGLTTEPTTEVKNVGPLLSERAFNDLDWLSKLDAKIYTVAQVDLKACLKKADSCPQGIEGLTSAEKRALESHEPLFRIQKQAKDYRFCFDETPIPPLPPGLKPPQPPPPQPVLMDAATRIRQATLPRESICKSRIPESTPEETAARAKAAAAVTTDSELTAEEERPAVSKSRSGFAIRLSSPTSPGAPPSPFELNFLPRSTEGIIYYLGEVSRCYLNLDSDAACQVKPTVAVKYRDQREESLFVLCDVKDPECEQSAKAKDAVPGGVQETIAVAWHSRHYDVLMDPSGSNRSGQVLRLLTQLLALNRSAKDYPAPAVLPVISH